MDIKKAFDRVPHKRLLWKLEHMGGLRGSVLKWTKDYLHGRKMITVIRDVGSNWERALSGVPQGLMLAPIMFQIHLKMICRKD